MDTAHEPTTLSYGASFYSEIAGGSFRSASIVLPLVFDVVRPRSVIDIGCGVGTWLRAARTLGVEELCGIDGSHVPKHLLEIELGEFNGRDLTQPLGHTTRRYDLVLSLEVAEHLPHSRADSFVGDLCALGDAVLFSAAIPGQGGQEHVNEERQSVWAERFMQHGFQPIDVVRPAVWSNTEVEYWYQQNTILYVADSRADLLASARAAVAQHRPLFDVVHPTPWVAAKAALQAELHSQPGLRLALQRTRDAARNAAAARLHWRRQASD